MEKHCSFCDNAFKDKEEVTAIVKVYYKEIPSRIHYGLSEEYVPLKIYHDECYDAFLDSIADESDDDWSN